MPIQYPLIVEDSESDEDTFEREGFTFYLGTHHPVWLAQAGVPLFVSYQQLRHRKRLPRAKARWALDSGGFTELSTHGRWTLSARDYAQAVQRYQVEIGSLDWAAVQDWMCEPEIRQRTGLSTKAHQQRTVESWLRLSELAPEVSWLPVLQGWTMGDYLEHAEMYDRAEPSWRQGVVGLGSICRRQGTARAQLLINLLCAEGLRLHAFGFKKRGLVDVATKLRSADSLAWSYHARKSPPLAGCNHARCNNCMRFALEWRADLTEGLRAN